MTDDRRTLAIRIVCSTCSAFNLTRADRLEWAGLVLNRNLDSFNDLSLSELETLVVAAQGAVWMARIKLEYKSGQRVAQTIRPRWPQAR
jgi:hypothetical protein